jgi:hypothetical protein
MVAFNASSQTNIQSNYDEQLQSRGIKTPFYLDGSKYTEIIDLYTELGNEFQKNVLKENALFLEIDSLSQSKNNYEDKLNKFVSSYPDSYIPYYLRATYLSSMAWNKRGDKFISETTKSQVNGFIYYKELAQKDIDKAIIINNQLSWLYTQKSLILVGQRGVDAEKTAAFKNAF